MTRDDMRRSVFEDKYPPPEGVEWVEELGYYSTKDTRLLPDMDTYNEWLDVWVAALHSVEAEKEPVNLPPAKPDLDPVEAHKRGEFVSDVEAAYNDGWNDCRHAAMYQTEKERLVELSREMFSADSACGCGFYDDDRWRSAYFGLQVAVGSRESTCVFDPETDEFPAPPDHKPE